jgi:hypothetical protein
VGRLPFWLILGAVAALMLFSFIQGEWQRLSRPDDPIQREFLLFYYVIGAGSAYVLGRAIWTVAAELRDRRRRKPE